MRLTDMILVQEHAAMLLQSGGDCWLCGRRTTDFKEPNGKWVHFSCDKRHEDREWITTLSEDDETEGE